MTTKSIKCKKGFSIRFKNFDYRINGVVKQVFGVEKIGDLYKLNHYEK